MWGGRARNPFILGGAALSLSAVITPILGGGGFSPAERGAGTPPPVGYGGGGGHLWGVMGGQGEGGALWGAPQRLPAVLQAEHIQHPHRDKRMDPTDPHRTM